MEIDYPAGNTVLWDTYANGCRIPLTQKGLGYNFLTTIRELVQKDPLGRIYRSDIEKLIERIQLSLFLQNPDPDFPVSHGTHGFSGIYKRSLIYWEARFQYLLDNSPASHFELT